MNLAHNKHKILAQIFKEAPAYKEAYKEAYKKVISVLSNFFQTMFLSRGKVFEVFNDECDSF